MRWAVILTFAAFLAILVVVWIASEKADPKMIDVDPATAKVELVHR